MFKNHKLFHLGHKCFRDECCLNVPEYDSVLALLCTGLRMTGLSKLKDSPNGLGCEFVFLNHPEFGRAIHQYYNNDLQVNPLSYHKYDVELKKEIKKFLKNTK